MRIGVALASIAAAIVENGSVVCVAGVSLIVAPVGVVAVTAVVGGMLSRPLMDAMSGAISGGSEAGVGLAK